MLTRLTCARFIMLGVTLRTLSLRWIESFNQKGLIFRDIVEVLVKIKIITDGMGWESRIMDHETGQFNPEKILLASKSYWTGEAKQQQS